MKQSEEEVLAEALAHLAAIERYSLQNIEDEMVQDAVALRLVALIETLGRLPEETRQVVLGDDWRLMRGMRNRLVHGYMTVDPGVIRVTVSEELKPLRQQLEGHIARLGAQ